MGWPGQGEEVRSGQKEQRLQSRGAGRGQSMRLWDAQMDRQEIGPQQVGVALPGEKTPASKHSSTSGLSPRGHLEWQAEFHASTQDEIGRAHV